MVELEVEEDIGVDQVEMDLMDPVKVFLTIIHLLLAVLVHVEVMEVLEVHDHVEVLEVLEVY